MIHFLFCLLKKPVVTVSSADATNDSSIKNIVVFICLLQVNRLNDSHAQLMVHWLGEGTDVIICLAREPPLSPLEDPKKSPPPSPSSVFLSYNYGDTFEDKSQLFNLTINGSIVQSTVDEFITHLKFNTVGEE